MSVTDVIELENDILSSCVGSSTGTKRATEALDGYKFSDKAGQWIWRAIKGNFSEHGNAPRVKVLAFKASNDIKNEGLFDEVVERLRELTKRPKPTDLSTILPEIIKAYNQQRILETVDQLIDAAEEGDLKKAEEILAGGASSVNRRAERTGSGGVIEIAKKALSAPAVTNAVPTGLGWVDRRISGIAPGQLFLIAGITGIGKSVSMVQAGHAAIGRKKRVIHFTTEMGQEPVAYRYLSRFTGIPEKSIREDKMSRAQKKLLSAWIDRNEERLNDLLKIEQIAPNSGTTADIQAGIAELERDGKRPDLVIIDSPDHLRSIRKYSNWLHESTEVWWGVKAIADQGYATWATTQITRGKWERKLATPEAVADNYNKARICDAFFSVNWTLDKRGRPTGKRRLFWGKYRSGESRIVIPLKCDLSRMVMVTEPEPEELDLEDVDS